MKKQSIKHKFYRNHSALIYLLLLTFAATASLLVPKLEIAEAKDPLIIPEEAIRLRILANSDNKEDQKVKQAIRDQVNAEINRWVEELTSLEDARNIISSQLEEIEEIAEQELKKHNLDYSVKVEFGKAQFPTKLYGQFLYPAGTYEAIIITLGEGNGQNWWCVLFPPLCFLDFSNGVAVSETEGIEETEADTTTKDEKQEVSEKSDSKGKKKKEKSSKKTKKKANNDELDSQEESENEAESVDKDVDETSEAPLVVEDEDEVEVKFFLVELFHKFF